MFNGNWGTFVLDDVELTSRTTADSGQRLADIPAEAQRAAEALDGALAQAAAIPLQALGAKAEGVWRVNFGREEADTHRASCWSPTLGSFHTPARFGEMGF